MPPRAGDRGDQSIRTAQGAASHPAATTGHDARRAFWERERIARSRRAAGDVKGHPASGADTDAAGHEARWASWEKN